MRPERRLDILIFAATFLAFGYFNQGGGWNQNSRFAEVRAMAEQGRFAIDDFLVYQRNRSADLKRLPVNNGDVIRNGGISRLSWLGDNELVPVNGLAPGADVKAVPLSDLACSGDISFARGHFHPNKPPGSSFVAVPSYWLLENVERWTGHRPDDWRLLVVNAWLCSAFSVGLISAAGCLLFFRLTKILLDDRLAPAFWCTLIFAFGTLFFPFATLLFDHNLTAIFLLASFYLIFTRDEAHASWSLYLSGLAAGLAAITNYVAAAAVVILGIYLILKIRHSSLVIRHSIAFALGLLGPFLAICFYNQVCYGSPFALSNDFQNPLFKDDGPTFLGMFGIPRLDYAIALLFSPFRGLFFGAPVLAMSVIGWWKMRARWPAEAWLAAAMFGLFFLVNISFFGWHGGFASGPRYLIPALPFLALPMALGLVKFPRFGAALALISIATNFLYTAVDPEAPVGVGSLAACGDQPLWRYSPLLDYALPLFVTCRAWPLLDRLLEEQLQKETAALTEGGSDARQRARMQEQKRNALLTSIRRGDSAPFLLAAFVGPVSVNPIGVYEAGFFQRFGAHSKPAQWASFNAGELFAPRSRLSLLPLLLGEAGLIIAAYRITLAQRPPRPADLPR